MKTEKKSLTFTRSAARRRYLLYGLYPINVSTFAPAALKANDRVNLNHCAVECGPLLSFGNRLKHLVKDPTTSWLPSQILETVHPSLFNPWMQHLVLLSLVQLWQHESEETTDLCHCCTSCHLIHATWTDKCQQNTRWQKNMPSCATHDACFLKCECGSLVQLVAPISLKFGVTQTKGLFLVASRHNSTTNV